MTPRIRSLSPRRPFARETKAQPPAAPAAPRVFCEFVHVLQKLDPPPAAEVARSARPSRPRRRRAHSRANGHARPRRRGPRS